MDFSNEFLEQLSIDNYLLGEKYKISYKMSFINGFPRYTRKNKKDFRFIFFCEKYLLVYNIFQLIEILGRIPQMRIPE